MPVLCQGLNLVIIVLADGPVPIRARQGARASAAMVLTYIIIRILQPQHQRGWVTYICISEVTIIDSDNGLSPGWRQAITWANVGILWNGPLGTNFIGRNFNCNWNIFINENGFKNVICEMAAILSQHQYVNICPFHMWTSWTCLMFQALGYCLGGFLLQMIYDDNAVWGMSSKDTLRTTQMFCHIWFSTFSSLWLVFQNSIKIVIFYEVLYYHICQNIAKYFFGVLSEPVHYFANCSFEWWLLAPNMWGFIAWTNNDSVHLPLSLDLNVLRHWSLSKMSFTFSVMLEIISNIPRNSIK